MINHPVLYTDVVFVVVGVNYRFPNNQEKRQTDVITHALSSAIMKTGNDIDREKRIHTMGLRFWSDLESPYENKDNDANN